MAAAYVWGWILAHPVILFVWGGLGGACVLGVTAYYWATSEPRTPRRELPRSRARGTRTRRRASLSACRRVRAVTAGSTSWGRRFIALRIHGLEIDLTQPAGDSTDLGSGQAALRKRAPQGPLTPPSGRGECVGGSGSTPDLAAAEPTRKATPDECRDARLDYAPAPPFTDWLSDDTLARGIQAVQ